MPRQNSRSLPLKILALLRAAKEPLSSNELLEALYLNKRDRDELYKALDALRAQGVIERLRGNRYQSAQNPPQRGPLLYRGTFSAHPKGFGFFVPDGAAKEGEFLPKLSGDAFVPPSERNGALHGDTVTAQINRPKDGRPEARIVSVLSRARTRFAGILRRDGGRLFVDPEDNRLPGPIWVEHIAISPEPMPGQSVLVEMTRFPSGDAFQMSGTVIHLHTDYEDPRAEVERLAILHGLPLSFSEAILQEAQEAAKEVQAQSFPERLDLRELPLVTIDGADARDFDDAVALIPLVHGFELTVAVADVSHYVTVGSALDQEAFERGTSVYFPDRVIPMLPHVLSNGICSLNPHVERLCLVAILELDKKGRVLSSRFDKAVMRSHGRLTYDAVAEVLEDKEGWKERHPALIPHEEMLKQLNLVASLLREQRMYRGSLDFDLPEAQIIFAHASPSEAAPQEAPKGDEPPKGPKKDGLIEDIVKRPRNNAHKLIEDCMLAANEAVAALFTKEKITAPYRIHELPDPQKLENFSQLSQRLGYPLTVEEDEITPREISAYLSSLEGKPSAGVLHQMLLRSLKQARYSTQNVGHFGLAARDYLHFTSPIRRYPDLVVHRILSRYVTLSKKSVSPEESARRGERFAPLKDLEAVCVHASQRERRAFVAERDVDDLWRAYFMRGHLGEVYEGKISGVSHAGFFVTLSQPFVDGLVPIETLPGFDLSLDEDNIRLVSKSGYVYTLGDPVTVKVMRAAWRERKVDFSLVEHKNLSAREAVEALYPEEKKRHKGPDRERGRKPSQESKKQRGPERDRRRRR